MHKLALYDFFTLGKHLASLADIKADTDMGNCWIQCWSSRAQLDMWTQSTILLDPSKRAAGEVIKAITAIVPTDFKKALELTGTEKMGWRGVEIADAYKELESVFRNDMPGIAAYIISKKGIYSTDDLILHADNAFVDATRKAMPAKAVRDFQEAGKCLAYEVGTACAFHLWRSVETVTEFYYEQLTGQDFDKAGVTRNWGAYIVALNKAGADKEITTFLDHIRKTYRNPQTHPDKFVDVPQALRLFGVAISSIDQMMAAVEALPPAPTPASSASPTP